MQEEVFKEKLNQFTVLLKEAGRLHAEQIVKLSQQQQVILNYQKYVKAKVANGETDYEDERHFLEQCNLFEKRVKESRNLFQQLINDTNAQLGTLSNHWGGYVEQLAVTHFLNTLRKEWGVHTWVQKFKRYWHKSRNVEVDILALNDDTAYIIEVKNSLKREHFLQLQKIADKLNEHVPELDKYKKQFILMCVNSNDELLAGVDNDTWIIKYNGFNEVAPTDDWVWLKKN